MCINDQYHGFTCVQEEKLMAGAAHDGAIPSVVASLRSAGGAVVGGLLFHRLTLLTNVFRENVQDPIEFNDLSKNTLSTSKSLQCIVAAIQLALRRLQLKQPMLMEDAAAASTRIRSTKIVPSIMESIQSILSRATPATKATARSLFPAAGELEVDLLQEIEEQLRGTRLLHAPTLQTERTRLLVQMQSFATGSLSCSSPVSLLSD